MTKSVFFKPVSIGFAIVTLIESILWGLFSFAAILCYLDIIKYDDTTNYGLNLFVKNLYNLYLSANPVWQRNRVVTPDIFYVLMWIYFLLSLFLCFTSGVHIAVLTQNSNVRKINVSTIIWQILTYTVCIFDLITCVLFAIDYHVLRVERADDSPETELTIAVVLTLFVLSAKGFVLWIFNFVLSIIVSVLLKEKVSTNEEPILRTGPEAQAKNFTAYNAYGDMTIDNREEQMNNAVENRSFSPDIQANQYEEPNNMPWFSKLEFEPSRYNYAASLPSSDVTISRIPRASSFRQPRSLAASLSPSPVPPASDKRQSALFERTKIYSSGYNSYDYGYEEDDEDDISESIQKMKKAYPKRFGVNNKSYEDENEEDDVSESIQKMKKAFPKRFGVNNKSYEDENEEDDVSESIKKMKNAFPKRLY